MKFSSTVKFSFLLLSFLPFASSTWALDIEDAVHAMREGNFAEAYCILRPHAEAGDAEAQYNIGWMYLNGYGLAINDSLALEWWQRASEQGYVDATFSMAMLYSLGEGQVKKDMDRAIDLYLLAAEEDHEDARLIISSMIQRDDKSVRHRKQEIINTHGSLLGTLKQVRLERVNVRKGPGTSHAIIASAVQASVVLALVEKGKWTQVALKDNGTIAWIYSSLLEDYVETKASVPEGLEPEDKEDFEDEDLDF